MSAANALLPPGFETLEPFAALWAVAGAANRAQRRNESGEQERTAFYNVAKDRLADALTYLDGKPFGSFDEYEQRLMNMLLSFAHVAMAVEILAQDEEKHAQGRQYLRITKATADLCS